MNDWQRGYGIEELRAIAVVFKAAYKPFIHGAFGLPKERDAADALASRELVQIDGAVAIGSKMQQASRQHDYAKRSLVIPRGTLYVRHLAFACEPSPEATQELLSRLRRQTGSFANAPILIEIHEENSALRAVLEGLGYRWQATKVMASSDLKSLWASPEGPAITGGQPPPPWDQATLGPLDERFCAAEELEALQAELQQEPPWAQHYSSYNWRQTWTAVSLRGFSDDPQWIIKPSEMSKAWQAENAAQLVEEPRWTPAASAYPAAKALAERMPNAGFERVRLMRVTAGGQLTRHADITNRDAGTADGHMARLHIPIVTNPNVRFIGWDERGRRLEINMKAGGLYYIDQRKPHAVRNEGKATRIHLVADVYCNDEVRAALAGIMAEACAP